MSETQTVDLASWLTAIWDEEERLARTEEDLVAEYFPASGVSRTYQWVRFTSRVGGPELSSSSFVPGAPSPQQVLARVAADRKILELHAPHGGECSTCCGEPYCEEYWDGEQETVVWQRTALSWPCPTVRLLASPYKGREGWQEAWANE